MTCHFFVEEYCGICLSQVATYIPSVAERQQYCSNSEFRRCPHYTIQGPRRIRVEYEDKTMALVDEAALDALIFDAKIRKFYRSSGWVTLGCDPVRIGGGGGYTGQERRKIRGTG